MCAWSPLAQVREDRFRGLDLDVRFVQVFLESFLTCLEDRWFRLFYYHSFVSILIILE